MEAKSHTADTLKRLISDFGVPNEIVCDKEDEQARKHMVFMSQARKHHMDVHITEPERYNQSKVEDVICKL